MVDISVIVPVYNAQRHLEQCLRSIMAQTWQNIEILCIDDGSTDQSPAILQQLAAEDARIRILRQENAGAGAARNLGLSHASGKYLSFLDSDDFFDASMLARALHAAEQDNAQIVIFGADFYNEKHGRYTPCTYSLRENMLPAHRPFSGMDVKKDIFKTVVGWAWDKLFLADFVRSNHLQFQQQRTSNDLFFVFSAIVRAERITTLSQVLAHQRRHAGKTLSVTREQSWMCFYSALTALRDQLKAWRLYERFEQDFINYALHFSLWNLNTLKGPARRKLYHQLRNGWFVELGITAYPREGFYHRTEYAQYQQIITFPYILTIQWAFGKIQRLFTWITRFLKY